MINENENEKVKGIELCPYRPKDLPSICVCLIQLPDFNKNNKLTERNIRMLDVVSVTDGFEDGKWNLICLNAMEKETIRDEMMNEGCLPDEWFWCVGYGNGKK